jgi:phytoene dehydrogenase-like protein
MEALMAGDAERVIIIGAGHNGLVAAFYLAKAGYAPLVLERADIAGGSAVTEEIHPGFRCPVLFDMSGPLLPEIERDMQLAKQGVETISSEVQMVALHPDRSGIRIYTDPARTASELERISSNDGRRFPEFHSTFQRLGRAIAPLLRMTPPDTDGPTMQDFLHLGQFGLKFQSIGEKDAHRLLRWGPMPVADLSSEWFENDLLRAAIESRGIFGMFAGPRSAGTTVGLLLQAALGTPAQIRGGLGALTQAMTKAASAAGAQIRTGSEVERIIVDRGKVRGIVLKGGEEIAARAVVSNADPHQTLLKLIGPAELAPGLLMKVRSYRAMGALAKVNLALSAIPAFSSIAPRIHIGPDTDYLERAYDAAKYGDFSREPVLQVGIPSQDAHVLSIFVHYAPYRLKTGNWDSRREELGDVVVKTLSSYAPGIEKLILARQILTPLDIERRFGMSGGHIFHGEQSLDQLFTFRPLLGLARYRTPIKGLYLCGSGTHPGVGITGASGWNASREILKDLK